MTEDERELRLFRKWLADQQQDAKEETHAALEPVEEARARLIVETERLREMRAQAERLEFEYREAQELVQKYSEGTVTWQITLHARVERAIEDSVKRIDELKVDEDGGAAVRELKRRVQRLLSLKDYKPQRALDVRTEDLKIQDATSEEIPNLDIQYQFVQGRLCASCGRAKLAGFHPLCLTCQRKAREGKLNGDWSGVRLLRAVAEAAQEGRNGSSEDPRGTLPEEPAGCDPVGPRHDEVDRTEGI